MSEEPEEFELQPAAEELLDRTEIGTFDSASEPGIPSHIAAVVLAADPPLISIRAGISRLQRAQLIEHAEAELRAALSRGFGPPWQVEGLDRFSLAISIANDGSE